MESPISYLQSSIFTFSQNSLQAYVDCPRRFQLRYLLRLAWPAPEVQPILEHEQHLQRGQNFHKLVQQTLLGIPRERLSGYASSDPLLAQWWRGFQEENPIPDGYAKHIEISLAIPIAEHRLAARYDLVAVSDNEVLIFDWKTNQQVPKRDTIQNKLQSRVYPYVLIQGGNCLNHGSPIEPYQVEMMYWFSNFPASPMHFVYSQERYEQDQTYLTGLVKTIAALGEDDFPRTQNLNHCRFCIYRSFCDRGREAGYMEDLEAVNELEESLVEDFDLDLDLEQITEIEF